MAGKPQQRLYKVKVVVKKELNFIVRATDKVKARESAEIKAARGLFARTFKYVITRITETKTPKK